MPQKKEEKKALPQMVKLGGAKDPRPMSVYRSALYQPKDIISNPTDGQKGHVYHGYRDYEVVFVEKDALWIIDPDFPVIRRASVPSEHQRPVFTGLFSQIFRRGS